VSPILLRKLLIVSERHGTFWRDQPGGRPPLVEGRTGNASRWRRRKVADAAS